MARSEDVAAAVALRAAGYKVRADARGALVEAVATDAPAAAKLRSGDVIVAARGRATRTPEQLRRLFKQVRPGADVVLRVRRDGKTRTLTVRTVESPNQPGRAIIGIRVAQDASIELPVKVRINLGGVGGPSAGLPFALDVLQELGTDVDKGRRVVATGEIALDGTVGPIGGVKQKTFGARRAHADVFLVPAGENAAEARRYAGNLRIIPVESFQQALSVLRTLSPE
jgi:PDZ domain-containing protein